MVQYKVTDASSTGGVPTIVLANLICATPWTANAVAATGAAAPAPVASMWLEPAMLVGYRLTAKAHDVFSGVFKSPPVATAIRFGWAGPGNSGVTIVGVVTLDIGSWNAAGEGDHIHLLCHEHTHLPQWAALGQIAFLARYGLEYRRADNYVVPTALAATSISSLEPTFTNLSWTMDQMAERTGNEAVRVAKTKGYIP